MNRKMRAKLNNAAARIKKERRSCPKAGEVVDMTSDGNCEECGRELIPLSVALVAFDDLSDSRTLN